MFKRILVAVDLDQPQVNARVIDCALAVADEESLIQLLTVVPRLGGSMVTSFLPMNYEKKALEHAQTALHQFSERALAGRKVKHFVAHGSIYEEISRIAREQNSDILVLGSGKNPIIGPNSARVMRYCPKPVLIAR